MLWRKYRTVIPNKSALMRKFDKTCTLQVCLIGGETKYIHNATCLWYIKRLSCYETGRLGWRHRRTRGRTQSPVRLQMLLLVFQLQQEVLLLHHDLPVRVVDGVLLGLWVCAVDILSRVVLHTLAEDLSNQLRPDAEILEYAPHLLLWTVLWDSGAHIQQDRGRE